MEHMFVFADYGSGADPGLDESSRFFNPTAHATNYMYSTYTTHKAYLDRLYGDQSCITGLSNSNFTLKT